MSDMIYHITYLEEWEQAVVMGEYFPPSLSEEGFIHFSLGEQVASTAERHYSGEVGLILLEVDPDKLDAELRYEEAPGGFGTFPHLYGPLNLDAVMNITLFDPDHPTEVF